LFKNIFAFLLFRIETASQKIAKKEYLQNKEHDEKLDQNDDPQLPSEGHRTEAVVVEKENITEYPDHRVLKNITDTLQAQHF
jgi:hypothetical protein